MFVQLTRLECGSYGVRISNQSFDGVYESFEEAYGRAQKLAHKTNLKITYVQHN